MVLRLQGVIAVAIPWIVAVVVAPGSWAWGLLSLIVPLVFVVLHVRAWQAWVAMASGVVSIVPAVPIWVSGAVAASVAVVLLVRPPQSASTVLPAWMQRPSTRWAAGGVLLIAAVALSSIALVQVRQQDQAFTTAQETAAEMWETDSSGTDGDVDDDPLVDETVDAEPAFDETGALVGEPLEVQEEAAAPVKPPFAKLRFVKKGTDEPVVTDRVLYVGPDITDRGLAAGPGHYPQTSRPGKKGNIAIAGHRTGWGSPFLHLDELEAGDRIKVVDRKGVRHTYVVDSSTLVDPSADWVLGEDPLGTGEPTLTLTTCDPPSVNTKRLIVFATLKKSVPLTGA